MRLEPKISIISPVYNSEGILTELVKRIEAATAKMNLEYEIILVDDGSKDNSWLKINEICTGNPRVRAIKLSRNFGQHFAITAGVDICQGTHIAIMDCDLQDDPALLEILFNKIQSGHDIVFTRRKVRQHSFLYALSAGLYNKVLNYLSDGKFTIDTGSLVMFTQKVKVAFQQLGEHERLYVQMLKWLGFNSTVIEVDHKARYEGNSSYTMSKILSLALSGLVAHSNKLLWLSVQVGFLLAFISIISICVIVFLYLLHGFVSGWPSIICAILLSTGLILMGIGVLGIYLGKVFNQVKQRPLYIIDTVLN